MKRDKRDVVYIFSEGKNNKTERIYFRHFVDRSPYTLRFVSSNDTSPKGILSFASRYLELNTDFFQNGKDKAFIVCDVDKEGKRQNILREHLVAEARKKKITFVFSNPCFEIWFLNHFKLTKKQFTDSESLLVALKKWIPNYFKSKDCFSLLEDKLTTGIKNSKEQYSDEKTDVPKCPGTAVFKLVELLLSKKK